MNRPALLAAFVLGAASQLLSAPQGEKKANKADGPFDTNAWKIPNGRRVDPRYARRQTFRISMTGRVWTRRFRFESACAWLARNQNQDGSFGGQGESPVHDVGLTGLALLAFLGDGNTMRIGPYKNEIKKAVKWLRTRQRGDGLYSSLASNASLFEHTIATLAMTETHGLSSYMTIRKNATRGAMFLRQSERLDPRTLGFELMLDRALVAFKLEGLAPHIHTTAEIALTGKDDREKRKGIGLRHPVTMLWRTVGPDAKPKLRMKRTPDTGVLLAAAGGDLAKKGEIMFLYFGTLAMRAHGGPDAELWLELLHEFIEKSHHEDGYWGPGPGAGGKGKAAQIYSTAMTVLLLQSAFDGRVPLAPDEKKSKSPK